MKKTLVPSSKLGTAFQSPSWRYQAIAHPEKFGFEWLCSRREVDAGHLTRLMPKGIPPASIYSLPVYFRSLLPTLPLPLAEVLIRVWDKHYFRDHKHKINFNSSITNNVPISLNMAKVKYLNDETLKALMYHLFNYKYNADIDEAVKFYRDPKNEMAKKWINYAVYGKLTDNELAKMWRKSPRFIKTVRLLFFDYSHWPDDKLVQYSLVRQLVVDGELADSDFHVFRRIHDLGLLGIKSIVDIANFTNADKDQTTSFIEVSRIEKLLNLNYSCTSSRDAINYNRVTVDYTNVGLKRLEIEQKAELLKLAAKRMAKEMGLSDQESVFTEEACLIEELRERAKYDHIPRFPSFIDIKTGEVKELITSS